MPVNSSERRPSWRALHLKKEFIADASHELRTPLTVLRANAAKYSPAGQPVTLRSAIRGAELVVEVADRGPGIPEVELPLIFERFYRVDKGRSRKQGGAGLGLAIARSIVEAHGGRIEAESTRNEGTSMRFYLPLATAPQVVRSRIMEKRNILR